MVNCDAAVADPTLDHLPDPPKVITPGAFTASFAAGDPHDAAMQYQQLYLYVAQRLMPWALSAAQTVSATHALRVRTASCLDALRKSHVIN